jgi:hypothetical protein
MRKFVPCLALVVASACANGPAIDACQGVPGPIRPTTADLDVISDPLNDQILALNLWGARVLGWKP